MQCRGEWKLARGDTNPECAWVRHADVWHGLHPLGDDLSCSRGLNEVIPTEKCARRECFRKESSCYVGLTIPAETIFGGVAVTVGIAALNPRLNMDYPLSGIDCLSALHVWRATSRSPLQLRGVTVVYFLLKNVPGVHVSAMNHHVTGIDDSCGNDIWGAVTVGIAALNPRLNMDYPLSGIDCLSALHVWRATSRSPLQLRGVTQVHFLM